jgi:hypothetical protein
MRSLLWVFVFVMSACVHAQDGLGAEGRWRIYVEGRQTANEEVDRLEVTLINDSNERKALARPMRKAVLVRSGEVILAANESGVVAQCADGDSPVAIVGAREATKIPWDLVVPSHEDSDVVVIRLWFWQLDDGKCTGPIEVSTSIPAGVLRAPVD